jgi:ADP-heptose:LPS heptosyltransferase
VRLTKVPLGPAHPQSATLELIRSSADRNPAQLPKTGAISTPSLQPIVFGFGRFGDMVMLSTVLPMLHQRFRKPCLVLAAGPWSEQIFAGHPDVEDVWSFTRHFPFAVGRTYWRLLAALRRNAPSPIYVFERQPRQLDRIRRMLSWSGVDPARCLFITEVMDLEEHWVDRFIRLAQRTPDALSAEGYPVFPTSGKPAPRLRVSDAERAECDAWLHSRGWKDRELVLIQPGNFRSMSKRRDRWDKPHADDKAWPGDKWVELLRRVQVARPEAQIVLVGSPQERPMLDRISAAAAGQAPTAGAVARSPGGGAAGQSPGGGAAARSTIGVADPSLRQLLALCEVADSMISIDTGPAHAAAAFGVPLVVMFGAESQRNWLPRSSSGSAVVGIGGPPVSTRVDQISVDEVFSAWCGLRASTQVGAQQQGGTRTVAGGAQAVAGGGQAVGGGGAQAVAGGQGRGLI